MILCLLFEILFVTHLYSSNAFNNDSTYYLDKPDDETPVGTHPQKDDLDVVITNNRLIIAAKLGNFTQVKKLLQNKNYKYSDQEIAAALYYATVKNFDTITRLLSDYATTNNITALRQSVDN